MAQNFLSDIKFGDNIYIRLGDGTDGDLRLYHNATHSYIDGANTGDLYIRSLSDDVVIQGADDVFIYTQGGEDAIIARGDAGVELFYNNSKKIETTNVGATITGALSATGDITTSSGTIYTNSGTFLIGGSTGQTTTSGTGTLQVLGTGHSDSLFTIAKFKADASAPSINFLKSRHATIGSNTIVQDDDNLGEIVFAAADGNDFTSYAAKIMAEVDGTPGQDDIPGRIGFYTTADGAAAPTLALTLDSSQNATFAGRNSITGGGSSSPVGVEGLHLMYDTNHAYIKAENNGTTNRALTFVSSAYTFNAGNATFAGTLTVQGADAITIPDYILHAGDDSKFGFPSNDNFKIRLAGSDLFTMSTTTATFTGRTDLQKDLRIRGNDASGSLGVVRFFTDSNNVLSIDTGNDGSNRTEIDGSGNATFAGNLGISGAAVDSNKALRIISQSTSATSSAIEVMDNSDTNAIIRMGEKSTDGGRFHMFDGGTEKIAFYTDGTDNHISAGNLGIGTTSPSNQLEVNSGTSSDIAKFGNDNGGFVVGYTTNLASIDLSESAKFRIRQGSSVPLTIDDSQRVGIGTASPDEKLHIVDSGGANIILNSDANTQDSGIYMSEGADATPTQNGAYVYYDASENTFNIATGGSSLTDRLTIARDTGNATFAGAVDIETGISLESGVLVIKNATGDSSGLRIFQDSSDVAKIYNNYAGTLELGLSNTTMFKIANSGGNIMLFGNAGADGYTLPYDQNPGYSNFSAGGFGFLYREAYDSYLTGNTYYYKTGGSSTWRYKFGSAGANVLSLDGGNYRFSTVGSGSADAVANFTERFTILQAGNVGIGDATPNTKLEVNGDTTIRREGSESAGELLLGGTTDGGFVDFDGTSLQLNTQRDPNTGTFVNTSKSHASIIMTGADADSSIKFYTTTSNNTTGTLRWTIDKNGALIKNGGTSSQFLMADGSVSTSSFNGGTVANAILLPDGGASAPSIGNTGDTNTGMYWPADHQLGFTVNNSRKFYMSETRAFFQNLSSGVHINSTSDAPLEVESSDATTGIKFTDNNANAKLYYVGSGNYFYTDAHRLGIGDVTAPSVALHVVGTDNVSSRFVFTKDLSTDKILFGGADHDTFGAPFIGSSSAHSFTITQGGGAAITIDTSKNATFAGTVTANRASNSDHSMFFADTTGGGSGSAGFGSSSAIGPFLVGNTNQDGTARGAYGGSRMKFNAAGFTFEFSDETSGARTFDTIATIGTTGNATFAGAITTNANNTFKSAAGSGSAVELNLIGTNTSGFGSTHAVRSRIRTVTNDSGNAYAAKLEFYTNDPSNNLDLALVLNSNQNATFYGDVGMATGHSSGKFAVMSSSVHGSYDFYNNGTSYFNGDVTIDANLTQTTGTSATFSGTIYCNNVGSDKKIAFRRTSGNNFSIEHDTSRLYFYNETTPAVMLSILNGGNIGIGTADPDGDGYSYAEDLVIKGGASASDGAGITIAGNGKTYGVIAFGDAADNNIGEIYYSHSDNSMNLRTNTNVALNLDSSGNAKIKGAVIVNNSSTISTTTTTGEYLTHQQNSQTMRLLGLSSSWCHILTTANYFYFDSGLRVDTGEIGTYNEDMQLNRAGTNFARGFANGIFQPHYLGGYDGVEGGSTGRRFITKGSGDNSIYFGCYDDNGYGYLENYNNSSGFYFNTNQGHFRFDTGSVIPYNDSEIYLGFDANRWICVYADGFNTSGQIDWTNGFSIKQGGSNYGRIDNWIDMQSTGLYSTTLNSAHIYPNNYSSYASMALSGTRGGYYGMLFANISNMPHVMFDASGNGGQYHQGSTDWATYWHVSNGCMGLAASTTSSSYGVYVTGAIYSTADIVAYSDKRSKENIVTVDNALDKVSKLRGVYYNKKDSDEKKREVGVIAQEVKEVLPEVVTYAKDVDEYGVDYGKINGLLIEAIKDLKKEVEELKQCKKCTDCDCNN